MVCRHAVFGVLSISIGVAVPLVSTNFYAFLIAEQTVATFATDAIVDKFGKIQPS